MPSDAAERDRDDDSGSDEVRLLITRAGNADCYHTDPDCYRVRRSSGDPIEATDSQIEFHELDECPDCAGEEYKISHHTEMPHPLKIVDDASLNSSGGHKANGPGEFHCSECRARCTKGPSGVEYGHRNECSNRPDEFPGMDAEFYENENSPEVVVDD